MVNFNTSSASLHKIITWDGLLVLLFLARGNFWRLIITLQRVLNKIRSDKMSVLMSVQTVQHSESVPKICLCLQRERNYSICKTFGPISRIIMSGVYILYYFSRWSQRGTCIKRLFWSLYEAIKCKLLFTNFFLLVYKNNSPSVKVWDRIYFYRCYDNKNGWQNRLKIEQWPFWSKFKTFDREINIEHKQIPKWYLNRGWELSWHTIY